MLTPWHVATFAGASLETPRGDLEPADREKSDHEW